MHCGVTFVSVEHRGNVFIRINVRSGLVTKADILQVANKIVLLSFYRPEDVISLTKEENSSTLLVHFFWTLLTINSCPPAAAIH